MQENTKKIQKNCSGVFPWDNSSLIELSYKQGNYKIVETNANNNNAIVFFSGNGIYYPNTTEVFKDIIVNKDRFEWDSVAKDKRIKKHYRLIIFVRDIYKQWYIKGINEKLNSQDKVIDFIKQITKGYKVQTCGNSAGGYMATLVGLKIGAEKIFNFSGQFVLKNIEREALLPLFKDNTSMNKYFSLINTMKEVKKLDNIYYFFPAKCEQDIAQYNEVKDLPLNFFKCNEQIHGKTISGSMYKYILTMSNEQLGKLYMDYKDKYFPKKKVLKRRLNPLWGQYEVIRLFFQKYVLNCLKRSMYV